MVHTGLSHSWCTAFIASLSALGQKPGACIPHCALISEITGRSNIIATGIFNLIRRGTVGCIDTELLTTVVTSGRRPALMAIMKLVDPWQCTTALILSSSVYSRIVRTAAGKSCTAASSRVYSTGGRSMLARQLRIHTS